MFFRMISPERASSTADGDCLSALAGCVKNGFGHSLIDLNDYNLSFLLGAVSDGCGGVRALGPQGPVREMRA